MNKLSYISSVLIDPYRELPKISMGVSCLVSVATGVIFLGTPHLLAAAYRHQHKEETRPNITHQKIAKLFKKEKKTKAELPEVIQCYGWQKKASHHLNSKKTEDKESLEYHDELEITCEKKQSDQDLVSSLKGTKIREKDHSNLVRFSESVSTENYTVDSDDDKRGSVKKILYHQRKKMQKPAPLSDSLQKWESNFFKNATVTESCEQEHNKLVFLAKGIIDNKESLCTNINGFDILQNFCMQNDSNMEELIADEKAFKILLKSDRMRRILFTDLKKRMIASPQSVNNANHNSKVNQILDYSTDITMRKLSLKLKDIISKGQDQDLEKPEFKKEFLRLIKEAFPGTQDEFFSHQNTQYWLETLEGKAIKALIMTENDTGYLRNNDASSSEVLSGSNGSERSSFSSGNEVTPPSAVRRISFYNH